MAQFPPLGLEIPEDHPDWNKYFSMTFRKRQMSSSDVEELRLMDRGDSRLQIEQVVRDHKDEPA